MSRMATGRIWGCPPISERGGEQSSPLPRAGPPALTPWHAAGWHGSPLARRYPAGKKHLGSITLSPRQCPPVPPPLTVCSPHPLPPLPLAPLFPPFPSSNHRREAGKWLTWLPWRPNLGLARRGEGGGGWWGGQGGRREGFLAPQQRLDAPGITHTPISTPPASPSTMYPARMRKGKPQPGAAKAGVQLRAPQPQPGGGHPCPALPKGTGDSRLAPVAPSERVLTRHHPVPSICFDPRAKYHVPQRESRSHLGRS